MKIVRFDQLHDICMLFCGVNRKICKYMHGTFGDLYEIVHIRRLVLSALEDSLGY